MQITPRLIKELRDKTGAGMMDCKNALLESDGNIENAVDYLRKKGMAAAAKRADRVASEGVIQSYIHAGGKLGVLVEVNCETDFAAKTEDFQAFAKNLAMHIAAANPLAVDRESLDPEVIEREEDIYLSQARDMGKPEHILEKITEGKMKKFYSEVCLMEQPYIRDTDITISDLLNELTAKISEKMLIRRFARFQLGEEA